MGIRSDIDEAKELWKGSSALTKLFICVTLFMTISSIASLSDVIFEWKGFFLDAIEFYQHWIARPIARVAARVGLRFSPNETHMLVVFSLWSGSLLRVSLRKWNAIGRSMQMSAVLYIVFIVGVFLYVGLAIDEFSDTEAIVAVGLFTVGFPLTIIGAEGDRQEIEAYGSRRLWRLAHVGPIAFAVLVVLILGGINAGLSRSLS